MAIAFDTFTAAAAGTGDFSWSHTGGPQAKGAIVAILVPGGGTDVVSSATYGGVAMAEVTGSPVLKSATEAAGVHVFFLGTNLPAGTQTVTVSVGSGTKRAGCWTVTALGDTSVVDTTSISQDSGANPSGTLSLGSIVCFCCQAFCSGVADVTTGVTPLTDWSSDLAWDPGAQGGCWHHYNIIGSTDVTMGYTAGTDDCTLLAVAVRENANPPLRTIHAMHYARQRS